MSALHSLRAEHQALLNQLAQSRKELEDARHGGMMRVAQRPDSRSRVARDELHEIDRDVARLKREIARMRSQLDNAVQDESVTRLQNLVKEKAKEHATLSTENRVLERQLHQLKQDDDDDDPTVLKALEEEQAQLTSRLKKYQKLQRLDDQRRAKLQKEFTRASMRTERLRRELRLEQDKVKRMQKRVAAGYIDIDRPDADEDDPELGAEREELAQMEKRLAHVRREHEADDKRIKVKVRDAEAEVAAMRKERDRLAAKLEEKQTRTRDNAERLGEPDPALSSAVGSPDGSPAPAAPVADDEAGVDLQEYAAESAAAIIQLTFRRRSSATRRELQYAPAAAPAVDEARPTAQPAVSESPPRAALHAAPAAVSPVAPTPAPSTPPVAAPAAAAEAPPAETSLPAPSPPAPPPAPVSSVINPFGGGRKGAKKKPWEVGNPGMAAAPKPSPQPAAPGSPPPPTLDPNAPVLVSVSALPQQQPQQQAAAGSAGSAGALPALSSGAVAPPPPGPASKPSMSLASHKPTFSVWANEPAQAPAPPLGAAPHAPPQQPAAAQPSAARPPLLPADAPVGTEGRAAPADAAAAAPLPSWLGGPPPAGQAAEAAPQPAALQPAPPPSQPPAAAGRRQGRRRLLDSPEPPDGVGGGGGYVPSFVQQPNPAAASCRPAAMGGISAAPACSGAAASADRASPQGAVSAGPAEPAHAYVPSAGSGVPSRRSSRPITPDAGASGAAPPAAAGPAPALAVAPSASGGADVVPLGAQRRGSGGAGATPPGPSWPGASEPGPAVGAVGGDTGAVGRGRRRPSAQQEAAATEDGASGFGGGAATGSSLFAPPRRLPAADPFAKGSPDAAADVLGAKRVVARDPFASVPDPTEVIEQHKRAPVADPFGAVPDALTAMSRRAADAGESGGAAGAGLGAARMNGPAAAGGADMRPAPAPTGTNASRPSWLQPDEPKAPAARPVPLTTVSGNAIAAGTGPGARTEPRAHEPAPPPPAAPALGSAFGGVDDVVDLSDEEIL